MLQPGDIDALTAYPGLPEILEYLFRHTLVQEAAYHSLLAADQKRLHLVVGEAILPSSLLGLVLLSAGLAPYRKSVARQHAAAAAG